MTQHKSYFIKLRLNCVKSTTDRQTYKNPTRNGSPRSSRGHLESENLAISAPSWYSPIPNGNLQIVIVGGSNSWGGGRQISENHKLGGGGHNKWGEVEKAEKKDDFSPKTA